MTEAREAVQSVTVTAPLGMHARAAARFVKTASRFASHVTVARDGRTMDGKSIMGLLLLAAARGACLTITARGADADDAVAALCRLVEQDFEADA